jgi:hypothetical protein
MGLKYSRPKAQASLEIQLLDCLYGEWGGILEGTSENTLIKERPAWRTPYYPGGDLLSHTVTRAVPSALKGLTSVFGKGTGVAPSL